MKTTSILFCLFFLFSSALYSQEPDEKNVVAKGCERIQDNLELKKCLSRKLSNVFNRSISKKLINELNSGISKFYLGLEIRPDKSIHLVLLNSTNPIIIKEFEETLDKVKILQPGFVNGQAVTVIFNLPLKINSKNKGISANYKLSTVTDNNHFKEGETIYPNIDAYCMHKEGGKKFECFNKYIISFFYNSVDSDKVSSMLNKGMNFFETKIQYNKNDKITKITSLSENPRLNAIFEKNIASVLSKSEFRSPHKDGQSYGGEMTLYIFYMKN
jgi:hypothetical protein